MQGITPPKFTPRSHELGVLSTTWKEFQAELNIYFLASGQNAVGDERKIALLLYQMGRQYARVFENELTFATPADRKKYDYVCQQFKLYFEPKKLTRSYISQFQRRTQTRNESVSDYITALTDIAKMCDFGDKEEELLCVQIGNGVRDEILKKKLWDESLSLKQIIEKCQTHELREEMFSSTQQTQTTNVNAVRRGRGRSTTRGGARRYFHHDEQPQLRFRGQHQQPATLRGASRGASRGRGQQMPREQTCRNCGRNHPPRQCPAFDKSCNACGRRGHFSVVCRRTINSVGVDCEENDPRDEQLQDFNNLYIFAVDKDSDEGRIEKNEWDVVLKTPYLNKKRGCLYEN